MKWVYGSPLTLTTENYILTSADPANLPEEMVSWYSDPEVMRFMNDPMDLTPAQLEKYYTSYNNKGRFALVITERRSKTPIGVFKIYIEHADSQGMTSVLIGNKEYWGKGIVLEIRERVLNFLFSAFRLNKVCGYVRGRNFPALFNYQKQHFIKEGVRKQHVRNKEGGFDDVVEFAMMRDDWLKRISDAPRNEPTND